LKTEIWLTKGGGSCDPGKEILENCASVSETSPWGPIKETSVDIVKVAKMTLHQFEPLACFTNYILVFEVRNTR
jgi:hypothetical protein